MASQMPFETFIRKSIDTCAVSVVILALLGLLSWLFDFWRLATLGRDYVPMAPSTASVFLLLACSVYLCRHWPSKPGVTGFAVVAIFSAMFMSLMVLVSSYLNFDLPLERWLAPDTTGLGRIPVGRMSPLTATTLLSISLAFLCELPPANRRRSWRQMAALLALSTLLISMVVLLSYGAGAPVLYSGQTIPMALPTALSFALLACGILLNAGSDMWPLSLFAANSNTASPSFFSKMAGGPLTAFLLLTLAIGTTCALYLKQQITHSQQAMQNELLAIAELKTDQIANWYTERQRDAEIILKNSMTQTQIHNYLTGFRGAPSKHDIMVWMDVLRTQGYAKLVLYDAGGTARLWSPSDSPIPPHATQEIIRSVIRARGIVTTDLHREPGERNKEQDTLNLWVPMGAMPGSSTSANGMLLLQIDPHQFLYPLIQSWPTPSRSAETLLVRREGSSVVFLNELRHRSDTAHSLRMQLNPEKYLTRALSLMEKKTVVEGSDYRDVPVLAAVNTIPGTSWIMVAKVDQQEVYAPLRQQALKIGIIMLVLIMTAAMSVSYLWQRRDNQWLQQQLAVELERTRVEERLKESNKRFHMIFEHSIDAIMLTRIDGSVLAANPEACRIFGMSEEEICRAGRAGLVDMEDPRAIKLLEQRNRTGRCQGEITMIKKDGSRFPAEISSAVFADPQGLQQTSLVIRDASERINLENQLRHLQKLEAVGTLAGGIAHEFNNILTAIVGYCALLEMDVNISGKSREYIDNLMALSEHASQLIQGLLAFSLHQDMRLTAVDLNDIVITITKLISRLIGEKIVVQTCISTFPLIINADYGQIEQVLMNLATNARDAINGDGTLIFSTDAVILEPGNQLLTDEAQPGSYALLSVSDTGCGMDDATVARIFEPFYTTKETGKGTGLGLSMLYGTIKQHHGLITVTSSIGSGTIFTIYIPLVAPAETAAPGNGSTMVAGGYETILVADDEPAVRMVVREILQQFGYAVIEAADGDEAVNVFRENAAAISLVILDTIMPYKNGIEAFTSIAEFNPEVKAIFYSGYPSDIIAQNGMLPENALILSKPVSPTDLLKSIRQLLDVQKQEDRGVFMQSRKKDPSVPECQLRR